MEGQERPDRTSLSGKFRASLLERLPWVKAKIDGSSSDGEELQSVDDVVQLLVQHAKGKREADFLEVWGDYREHLGDAHLETVHNAWEGNDGLIESALTTARENPHAWNATISDAILHMVSVEDYETIIKDNVNDTSTPFADGVCMGHIASITGQPMKQFTHPAAVSAKANDSFRMRQGGVPSYLAGGR